MTEEKKRNISDYWTPQELNSTTMINAWYVLDRLPREVNNYLGYKVNIGVDPTPQQMKEIEKDKWQQQDTVQSIADVPAEMVKKLRENFKNSETNGIFSVFRGKYDVFNPQTRQINPQAYYICHYLGFTDRDFMAQLGLSEAEMRKFLRNNIDKQGLDEKSKYYGEHWLQAHPKKKRL